MNASVSARLQAQIGSSAQFGVDALGTPLIAPTNEDAAALALKVAFEERWNVRFAGHGSWANLAGPADLVLSSTSLVAIESVEANDLVATVQSGVGIRDLQRRLASSGVWLPIDAPGGTRTLGSILACGTSGPLHTGLGTIRDHVLGATVIMPGGRVVAAGGKVVKNVAGFDLTKMVIGGFGAFGFVTSMHLRLRTLPASDTTLHLRGGRGDLLAAGKAVIAAGITPAALELSAADLRASEGWTLAVRMLGPEVGAGAAGRLLPAAHSAPWVEVDGGASATWWDQVQAAHEPHPTTIRIGAPPALVDRSIDAMADCLSSGSLAASLRSGVIRWSGTAQAAPLVELRQHLAGSNIPLIVERAPWPVLEAVGHYGEYRRGVASLVTGLREAFDPMGQVAVALGGST